MGERDEGRRMEDRKEGETTKGREKERDRDRKDKGEILERDGCNCEAERG